MEEPRLLWTLLLVICACCVVGPWSGVKATLKGLISVFRRD